MSCCESESVSCYDRYCTCEKVRQGYPSEVEDGVDGHESGHVEHDDVDEGDGGRDLVVGHVQEVGGERGVGGGCGRSIANPWWWWFGRTRGGRERRGRGGGEGKKCWGG